MRALDMDKMFFLAYAIAIVGILAWAFWRSLRWKERIRTVSDPLMFTEIVRQALATLPNVKKAVSIDVFSIGFELENGTKGYCSLANLWFGLSDRHGERIEQVEAFLRSVVQFQTGELNEVKLEDLVPIIKDERFIFEAESQLAQNKVAGSGKLYRESLTADLWIIYAFDTKHSIRFAQEEDITALGVAPQTLHDTAIKNVMTIIKQKRPPEVHGVDSPLKMVVCGGFYEASLLLNDSFWDDAQSLVKGRLLASVPTRDVLYFTGMDEPFADFTEFGHISGLEAMKRFAQKLAVQGSYPISQTILVRENGKWIKYS